MAATGQVEIQLKGGKTKTLTLENGVVEVNLGRFHKAGKKVTVTITYRAATSCSGASTP